LFSANNSLSSISRAILDIHDAHNVLLKRIRKQRNKDTTHATTHRRGQTKFYINNAYKKGSDEG
jgi:hypothetical protein